MIYYFYSIRLVLLKELSVYKLLAPKPAFDLKVNTFRFDCDYKLILLYVTTIQNRRINQILYNFESKNIIQASKITVFYLQANTQELELKCH